MLRQSILGILITALLSACSSSSALESYFSGEFHVPAKVRSSLQDAPLCCGSLSELTFENLSGVGTFSGRIDENSPAYAFDTGKSFLAAYRIADLPRPLIVRVASRRRIDPGPPSSNCVSSAPAGGAFAARTLVDESAAEATYLVVMTTDQLMTFHMQDYPWQALVSAPEFANQIAAHTGRLLQHDKFGFIIGTNIAEIDFERPGGGALARIGHSAVSGGAVTAFPCGLCEAGVCGPEMLAPCAALFSVGALVGGIAGGGAEIVAAMSDESKKPPDISGEVNRSLKPLVEKEEKHGLDRAALGQCLAERGYRYASDVSLSRIALSAEGEPAP